MIAKLPKRGQKCKKICHHKLHMIVYPPTLIRADFVFLHFAFLPFITETVSLKGESQSIIIWLNLISHHHLDEMDFLCNECAKSFAKEVDLVIHQARVHNKRSFSCEMCHVKFWMKILISQKLRKTLLWSRIWNSSISCAAFNRPSVLDSVAASPFVWNWLSWQIVSDDKIQITILMLRRGSLSKQYSLLSLLHWEQSGQVWKTDKQKGNLGEGGSENW